MKEGLRRSFHNRREPQSTPKSHVTEIHNLYADKAMLRLQAFARIPGVLNGFTGVQRHESTEGVYMTVDHDHGNEILESGKVNQVDQVNVPASQA